MGTFFSKLTEELGFSVLWASTRDTKLLCVQRFVRLFAYGGSALIMVLYLNSLGISDSHIGLFMTLTLLGDVIMSFVLTLFADGMGRKNVLILGALLMAASGFIFATNANYWILVAASIIGVISPSGNEIGPFRAIEESTLAQLSGKQNRPIIYAWYTLIGTGGAALGNLACGWVVNRLRELKGWTATDAFRVMFYAYAVIGIIKACLALMLSSACEAPPKRKPTEPDQTPRVPTETQPLLAEAPNQEPAQTNSNTNQTSSESAGKMSQFRSLLPHISPASRAIVFKLSLLFALDSFASGLVTYSWITYFFTRKFLLSTGTLGTLLFVCSVIAASSNLVAASIAKRIGNVKTMVFTHLPSSVALALIPVPNDKAFAMLFLVLRSCTSNMDVAPRQAFLAEAVLSSERTAVMGVVNVVKTLAQSGGPSVTGWLAGLHKFWVAFILAGALKATYDIGILIQFVSFQAREEEELDEAR